MWGVGVFDVFFGPRYFLATFFSVGYPEQHKEVKDSGRNIYNQSCPMCMNNFVWNAKICLLDCSHACCHRCIAIYSAGDGDHHHWKSGVQCPYCRQDRGSWSGKDAAHPRSANAHSTGAPEIAALLARPDFTEKMQSKCDLITIDPGEFVINFEEDLEYINWNVPPNQLIQYQ